MKKLLIIFAVILSMGFASCGDWLDINQDPNSPSEEVIKQNPGVLLPAVEMNIATSYGNFLRIAGGFYAQHYAHLNGTSNYVDYSRFQMSATRSSNTYTYLNTRVLQNLQTLRSVAEENEDWGSYLAATVLRAFTYQILVDCYGELPYTEAHQSPEVMQPKYDDGQVIYEGVLAELNAALEKVTSDELSAHSSFLFAAYEERYGLSYVFPWIEFANALKLKILMRMADVPGVDVQSQVAALIADDYFPTEDISWAGCWSNALGSQSPFYSEEFRDGPQKNVAANVAILQTMKVSGYTDPRLAKYYANTDANPGSISGTQYPGVTKLTNWCRPVVNWDTPVYLITLSEIEFFLAEYYARWGSATDAAAHYAAAVEASFDTAGVDGAADYVARYPYDQSNYKKSIGIAKWTALSGVNTFESWCEVRRLNYPAFGTAQGSDFYIQGSDASFNTSSYEPGTLYTPIMVFGEVGANKLLERFPYAEASTSRNPNAPDFPGYTTPVFWGK